MTRNVITAELISEGLETRLIGRKVLYYPTASSTNEIAIQESVQGASEGTVVIAGEQTRGRGRLNRSWMTPEGNIAFSVLLYPEKSVLPLLMMMASLGVSYAIEGITGLVTQIIQPRPHVVDEGAVAARATGSATAERPRQHPGDEGDDLGTGKGRVIQLVFNLFP